MVNITVFSLFSSCKILYNTNMNANTNINIKNEPKEKLISYALVLTGALVYVSLCFNNNVWLDEAFTASLVRTDMAGVLQRSMSDTLPPLYNILLKIVTDIFGYKITVMKLTSVAPMILTMLLSATVVRKRHGFKVSTLFTLCLMAMPQLLFFGVEIRMYSLGFFFATASGIYAYECIKDSNIKNWILFTVLSTFAGYSHHFAFVTVGLVYFYLLLYYFFADRKNIKRFFICLLFTFILYFPCLIVTLNQFKSVSGYFSMPDVTLGVFIKYMRYPYTIGFTPLSVILLIIMIVLFACLVFNFFRKKEDILNSYTLWCFLIFYCVLLFGTAVSKVMTSNIFVDRYLFFSIGLIWLSFSITVLNFKNNKLFILAIILIVLTGIAGYIREYRIEYTTNADAIDAYLEANINQGDVLYTIEDNEEMAFCLPFYEERLTNYEDIDEAISASINNNSTIWLSVIDYADYDFKELEDYGYRAEPAGEYTFDRYTISLYKLTK